MYKTYKIIGIEPWMTNNGESMQRLYLVHKKENTVGLACMTCSIKSALCPTDISIDSVVVLGFSRNSNYLDFVMKAPENN